MDLVLESVEAWSNGRTARYRGGLVPFINFLLPAHISSLAIAMLLYPNEQLAPIAFASALASGSKYIFRLKIGDKYRHFLNPSNAGIAITLILFPWVSIAPPYQYTENFSGTLDWVLPVIFIIFGTMLNGFYTRRLPLIVAWLSAFALQGVLRAWFFDTPVLAELEMMTGVAFLLFTFYMIEDPGTTPFKPVGQVVFGVSVAIAYAILMIFHIVFGLFFALFAVCIIRGLYLFLRNYVEEKISTPMQTTYAS
jgi:enediyne biosynthesis protein E5